MARRITHDLTYDAPLADVAAMLADAGVPPRCALPARPPLLGRDRARGRRRPVRIDQVQATQGIPSFAKKFVGDEIDIVQTERWTTADRGTSPSTSPASRAT